MDDIINRLSRQPGQPEQYKKFNPNPQPEYPVQNIQQFPQYEEWKSMIEGGTLPPEFDMRPGEEMPTGLPTEAGLPTEIPTEVPGEVSPDSSQAFFDMISELSTAQIEELDERGVFDKFFPDLAPPIEEDLPIDLTTEEGIYKAMENEQIPITLGRLLLEREHPLEGLEADIQSEITKAIEDGAIYEDIWDFLTNKETGLGLSNSEASKEIEIWVKENQDIPLTRK